MCHLRETRQIISSDVSQAEQYVYEQMQNGGVQGTGITRRRGRPKGSGIAFKDKIDITKGIQPSKQYVPFGKYLVNNGKINDNILSLKHQSGKNLSDFPSTRMSNNLGHVVRTIIGGGVPLFDELQKLTDLEKNYLQKVSKKVGIINKLSIPTPSKDQQEKDSNEFEIMKGEIMAGNDNKDMIKKFKLLILKLSKLGVLPKREASEVMQELIELGY